MHADTKSGKLTEIFRQHIVGTNQELNNFIEWYHRIQRLVNSLSGDLLDVEDTRALSSEYHRPAVLECHRTAAELLEMMKDESPFACFGSTVHHEMLPPFRELRRAVQELTTETRLRFQGRRCKGTLLEADCCGRFLDAQRYLARHAHDHSLLVKYKLIWDRRNVRSGNVDPTCDPNDDLIEDGLSGQQLKLYRFLKAKKHRTRFDTLADAGCWRCGNNPSPDAIVKALKRLQDALNQIAGGTTWLVIESANSRTYLDK